MSLWCNGECYCYQVEIFRARAHANGAVFDRPEDYRHDTPIAADDRAGFLDWDPVTTEARDMARTMVAEII